MIILSYVATLLSIQNLNFILLATNRIIKANDSLQNASKKFAVR